MVDDGDQPMLSLINYTGHDLYIHNLDGVEVSSPVAALLKLHRVLSLFFALDSERSITGIDSRSSEWISRIECSKRTTICQKTLGDRRARFSTTRRILCHGTRRALP